MKKLVFILFLLLSTGYIYAYDIVPKLSIGLPGTFRSDYEVEVGANVGAEGKFYLSDYFAISVGFDFLIDRKTNIGKKAQKEDFGKNQYYDKSSFHFLPVYIGIICFPLRFFEDYTPYIRLDGGYNVLFSVSNGVNSKPGYYFAGGIGLELLEKYIFELYAARYEADDNNNDITYKNILFKFGYRFEI